MDDNLPTAMPICPFCDHEDAGFYQVDDSEPHLNTCPACSQEYVVNVILAVAYTTAKPQDPGTGDLFAEEKQP